MARELNVLALIKGQERYVYVYDDASRPPLLETFRAQAADPQLSLNWFDAAVLTQKAREQAAPSPQPSPPGGGEGETNLPSPPSGGEGRVRGASSPRF